MLPLWLKIALAALLALLTASMAWICVMGTFAMLTTGAWGEGTLFLLCAGWLTGAFAVELVSFVRLPVRK